MGRGVRDGQADCWILCSEVLAMNDSSLSLSLSYFPASESVLMTISDCACSLLWGRVDAHPTPPRPFLLHQTRPPEGRSPQNPQNLHSLVDWGGGGYTSPLQRLEKHNPSVTLPGPGFLQWPGHPAVASGTTCREQESRGLGKKRSLVTALCLQPDSLPHLPQVVYLGPLPRPCSLPADLIAVIS